MEQDASDSNVLLKLFLVVIGGSLIACLGLTAFATGFQADYAGRILPGVAVAGTDVSGLSVEEAAARIEQAVEYPRSGRIAFQDGATVWIASPAELGTSLDAIRSAQSAYDIGRVGNPGLRVKGNADLRGIDKNIAPFVFGID